MNRLLSVFAHHVTLPTLSIVQNFISIGQGVTVWRGSKIACSHRKAESCITLRCTTVHVVIALLSKNSLGLCLMQFRLVKANLMRMCLAPVSW
jgi:hypothetical protein